MLKVGDQLPEFVSVNQDGETVNSQDLLGKKLVIFFYPKANTPGCTAEACNLRDNYDKFTKQNYVILGVSADSAKAQGKFKEKFNFPFPLIADEEREMLNTFEVWGPKKFMGKTFDGIHRTTFVIDENGVISDVITNVKTKDHSEQILTS